jgi:hypothetical protein
MDSEYLASGGFSREKELKDLEERLVVLRSELGDEGDSGHGRPVQVVADEIAELEAKIRLLKMPTENNETQG